MAENKMEQVAHLLGVEIGERFNVRDDRIEYTSKTEYYFDKESLKFDGNLAGGDFLLELLRGDTYIIKKPWKPKRDDDFYFVDESGDIRKTFFVSNAYDLMRYKIGNCYRTEAEAKAHAEEWKRWFESDEQVEVLKHGNN